MVRPFMLGTHCGLLSSPHWMEMFMRSFSLNTPLSFWQGRVEGVLVSSVDGCPTGSASVTFESAPVGSRWHALEATAGSRTGDAIIIVWSAVGGITSLLYHQGWRLCTLALRRRMFALCQRGLTLVRTCTTSRSKDYGPRTDSQWRCHHGHCVQQGDLNMPIWAVGEAALRRLQFWKRYIEMLRASMEDGVPVGHATERHLFLDRARPKGTALVNPELEKWSSAQLAEEAVVLRKRRKGHEECEWVAAAPVPDGPDHRKPK